MFKEGSFQIAVIGDGDILIAFRGLGMTVFSARREEEALAAIEQVMARKFGLCLLQQEFYHLLKDRRKKREARDLPVFLPFRDYRGAMDLLQNILKDMAIKATGSDSLIRRKG